MPDLGERVKIYRKEQNISLRALGDQTGVTATYLSQIERGTANPSIDVLRKISRALHVPIFNFLLEDDDEKLVVRKDKRLQIKLPHTQIIYELLTPDLKGKIEMFQVEVNSNEIEMAKPTEHPTEECILVLSGTMRIQVREDVYLLDAGDSIRFNGLQLNSLKSAGSEKLVFITAVTPPIF